MRFRVLVVAAVASLALAGCGEKTDYVQFGETEGINVDVGNLVYQVQLSRYLNPGDVEDKEYLVGLPADAQLGADEIWFGVFMRVKNYTEETLTPTDEFIIKDTEENEFLPIELDPSNVFAFHAVPLGPSQVIPTPDTAAASGPIQGKLILFKLKNDSLQNRPLVLHIEQEGHEPAHIDLDL